MADGDHCRSIMFYGDPGIDNRRIVPAAHFEQRGDAFVPFFQDDNQNEVEVEAQSSMEPSPVNQEPRLPPWPVAPVEDMEEPDDFLLYDFDDTDDSSDKSSDFEEDDSSDEFDQEVNGGEPEVAGEKSKIKTTSIVVGDEAILEISQKRNLEQDGRVGVKTSWRFSYDNAATLEDIDSQPSTSVHVVEKSLKDLEYKEVEVGRNSGSEQDNPKNHYTQRVKKRTEED